MYCMTSQTRGKKNYEREKKPSTCMNEKRERGNVPVKAVTCWSQHYFEGRSYEFFYFDREIDVATNNWVGKTNLSLIYIGNVIL